ncbi:hypothetical protein ACFOLK_11400 [Marinococcus halophilus]|uniref:Uncharacterized protein n=1 Tax=Marinococcus halophilus TaxID=1371 RepID=A0A510Y1H2_MARHA|nr:hypothetical protein [Marinococcus halophilus]GEK57158.1 hypothetical protein MHA01_00630 [Marinococcus halophilus]
MKQFVIELRGIEGEKAVQTYVAASKVEAMEKAIEDGALVITEIEERGGR